MNTNINKEWEQKRIEKESIEIKTKLGIEIKESQEYKITKPSIKCINNTQEFLVNLIQFLKSQNEIVNTPYDAIILDNDNSFFAYADTTQHGAFVLPQNIIHSDYNLGDIKIKELFKSLYNFNFEKVALENNIDEDKLYALMMLLHEIGHSQQDIEKNIIVKAKKQLDKFYRSMVDKIDNYSLQSKLYRRIPFERKADKFAIKTFFKYKKELCELLEILHEGTIKDNKHLGILYEIIIQNLLNREEYITID